MTARTLGMLKAHVAETVIGVAKVELRRIVAERLAATPAQVRWLVDGDELGAELLVRRAVATLGGGGPWPLMGGAAALPSPSWEEGRAAGLKARSGWHGHTSTLGISPCNEPLVQASTCGSLSIAEFPVLAHIGHAAHPASRSCLGLGGSSSRSNLARS
jgi:hypothetical protein